MVGLDDDDSDAGGGNAHWVVAAFFLRCAPMNEDKAKDILVTLYVLG
jgi:hypothetical protein